MGDQVASGSPGILPAQARALERLAAVLPASAYLAGGVAIALRYHHRTSGDLDLFMPGDPTEAVLPALERQDDVEITLRKPGTLYVVIDGVPISFLTYAYPHLAEPQHLAGVPVPVAAVADLVTMKLAALADRGAARDFWDLHELLERESLTLTAALALFQRRFPRHDIGHVIRALVYFADAEQAPFPEGLTPERWDALKLSFASRVRDFARP